MSTIGVRCILLDMGKVLLDFDFKHFGDRMCALTGADMDALRAAFTADGLARRYESGFLSDREFYSEVCRRLGGEVGWHDFVCAWNSIFEAVPILPDELIRMLSERSNLWVVSNTNRIHFQFILERYPLLRHFKGYILSHEVGAMKPDPRIFEAALTRAGARPAQTLFVDDQIANVKAARELGIDAFQFVDSAQFKLELQARRIL